MQIALVLNLPWMLIEIKFLALALLAFIKLFHKRTKRIDKHEK